MNPQDELKAFEASLAGYAYKTKLRYIKHLGLFLEWIMKENLSAGQARTVDMLAFIDSQKNNYSPQEQHKIIHSIKTWYTFKGYKRNPALGLKIRYHRSNLPQNLLDRKTLDAIYYQYESTTVATYRNKVIIGLLVFQGLTSGEIKRLKVQDIKLESGKIYVAASKRNNSRTLTLEACQILEMKTYLDEIRTQFEKDTDQFIIHRKAPTGSRRDKGTSIQNLLNHLFKALKEKYPKIKHAGQACPAGLNARRIRQSVIVEWLKEKDVRIVQYLAGHKKVMSTERYQSLHLKDLQEQLDKFHPLQ